MTRNINTSRENTEEANVQKKIKKADESMTTRAIRGFIEKKLSDGGDVFNQMVGTKCTGLETEFATFIAQNRDFDEQSKEHQESFHSVDSAQFLRETIAIGAAFTSRRHALEQVISRGYDFSVPEMKKVRAEYEGLSRDELTNIVQSEIKREKFLKNIFPKKTLPYKSGKEQIDSVFGYSNLNSKQEDKILDLIVKRYVSPIEVEEIINLFDPTQQQLLLKLFVPTISLGRLKEMGVLTGKQVKSAIHKSITQGNLVPQFASMNATEQQNAIDQINPDDIIIETMLFPNEVVKTILLGDGAKMIAQELSNLNADRYDAIDAQNALKMKPVEGLFLPSFLVKLNKLGIKNTADLKEGSIIRGTIPGNQGKDIAFAYRIDGISDNPEENKINEGNGRVFALSDVLLSDGSLHLGAKKSMSAECTYSEMYHIFDKAKTTVEILSPANRKLRVDGGIIKETLLEDDIKSLSDLNRALDSIDLKGKAYSLKKEGGACIQTGDPGEKDFCIFQIKSINEDNCTVELTDGQGSEILDYMTFYTAFQSKKNATRLPSMKTTNDFLSAMKSHGIKKEAYSSLAIDGDKIVSEDRKGEKDYPGVTEFAGSKGYIKILDTKTAGVVDFIVYKEYDESKRLDEQKKSERYVGGYNLLYNFLSREAYVPVSKDKEIQAPEKVDSHAHYHQGRIKSYFGNPSLHDIFKGGKDLIGFLKHHLEHGSHIQSANMQLALGKKLKWLGVDDGMIRELRAKVYSGNKKLMTEMVDEFKGMPSKERQKEVEHILLNMGAHDYEIQAATIAMLQKHGTLYVGLMKEYQGSFLYFERIAGVKYSQNLKVVQDYMASCKRTGEPFREEGLIMEYLRWAGGEAGGYKVDGNLWLEIKKGWKSGMDDESAGGKRETDQLYTSKGRSAYVMSKWKDSEYANGLGGIDSMWGKGGKPHEMHLPGIVLALSGIPGSLHQDQLNTLKNKFFGGHPYTALLFLGTQGDQKVFQSVIKRLCEDDTEMIRAYKKIESLQGSDPKKGLIETIINFWDKYGSILNNKLNVTQDGTLLHLAKTDKNCASYLKTCNASYMNMDKPDPGEISNEAFEHQGSSFLGLNSEQYFKFMRVNAGQSVLELNDEVTSRLFSGFKDSVGALKSMKIGTPEDTEEVQKTLYLQYHKAFMQFLMARFKDKAYEDVRNQIFFKEMESKYSMSLVPYGISLDSVEYRKIAEDDFDVYMKKGGRSVVAEKINVAENVEGLLEQTGYRGPAINDAQIRQAA